MKLKLLMNITMLCLTYNLQSQIIFVKPNGTGDGSTWDKARGDLRQALNASGYGAQIWVAKGTYSPTNCTTCGENDRRIAFELPNGVALYGGFSGNETQLTQRNWIKNKTILSGDIDKDGTNAHNTYNIFYLRNVSYETVIDGFTLTGGNADSTASPSERYASGGAIYLDGRSGGFANPAINNCIFTANSAVGLGGAVFNNGGFNGFCSSTYKNCQFLNNYSGSGGGGVCNWGVYRGICLARFEFCRFIGNRSNNSGAAVLSDGQQGRNEATFINCQFIRNETPNYYGAAIYNLGKGGICTPTVTGCLFWANKSFSAAGIYCLGSENGNSSPIITNCIFYKNQANTGGSVYANAGEDTLTGKPTGIAKPLITNCIIWGNIAPTGPQLRNINGTPTLSHSIVDAPNCSAIHSGVGAGVTCKEGMLYNQNPLFVDADNGDFRFLPSSPAINAGSNTAIATANIQLDADSLPRIVGNTVDIGVWEFNPSVQFPPQVLVSPESRTVCAVEKVVLKTYVTGSQPLYFQWYKNNIILPNATADSLKMDNIALSDSGLYKCIVRNDINLTATTEEAMVKVKPLLPLSIHIVSQNHPLCEGDLTTLKATAQNSGSNPKFEWMLNGTIVAMGEAYTIPIQSRFHKFTCRLTSSEQCALPKSLISNELDFPVEKSEMPEIALLASVKNICLGEKVLFTTTVKNGGDTPQYQWLINDNPINNATNAFETTTLLNGDNVKAVLKSSKKCVLANNVPSNTEVVFVKSKVSMALTAVADKAEICMGDTMTFTANGKGGGDAPQYQWFLNNALLSEKSNTLKITILKNNDQVKVVFKSSETCTVKNPIESPSFKITVNEPVIPTIDLTVSKFILCKGERVTFEATGKNIGATPQYRWLRNGVSLNWDKAVYNTDSVRIDDVFHVVVTPSNGCIISKDITSKNLNPYVRICLSGKAYGEKQALIFPNPSSDTRTNVGLVNLQGTVVIDVLTQQGQILLTKTINNVEKDKEVNVEIPELPDGLYLVRVVNGDFSAYKKWMIAR